MKKLFVAGMFALALLVMFTVFVHADGGEVLRHKIVPPKCMEKMFPKNSVANGWEDGPCPPSAPTSVPPTQKPNPTSVPNTSVPPTAVSATAQPTHVANPTDSPTRAPVVPTTVFKPTASATDRPIVSPTQTPTIDPIPDPPTIIPTLSDPPISTRIAETIILMTTPVVHTDTITATEYITVPVCCGCESQSKESPYLDRELSDIKTSIGVLAILIIALHFLTNLAGGAR